MEKTIEVKHWYRWGLYSLMAIAAMTAVWVLAHRIRFELANRKVELVVSMADMRKLAALDGEELSIVLTKMRIEGGITGVTVEEATLTDWEAAGKVTIIKGADALNVFRMTRGLPSRFPQSTVLKADRVYLITDESAIYAALVLGLTTSLGQENVVELDRVAVLEVRNEPEDLLMMGIAPDPSAVDAVRAAGLSILPRIKESVRFSPEVVRQKFQNLSRIPGANQVIFQGTTILGYPRNLRWVASAMESGGYQMGYVEFQAQTGDRELARLIPTQVIRVHSVAEGEMTTLPESVAVDRYIRSAKERATRILFIHPYFTSESGESLVALNVKYVRKIRDGLVSMGFTVQPFSTLPWSKFRPISGIAIGVISLGVLAGLAMLMNVVFQWKLIGIWGMVGAVVVMTGLGVLDHSAVWVRLISLTATVVFPVLAMILHFPTDPVLGDFWVRLKGLARYLALVVGTTALGALFVAALLTSPEYMLGIWTFFGVKFALLGTVLAIGLYFFLRPHRLQSLLFVGKRLMGSSVRFGGLLAMVACLGFLAIYVVRSGNYFSNDISSAESHLRSALENFFFVRPRTKEFLIGYPALVLGWWFVDRRISRQWIWFVNVFGVVALISITNSFCHAHTPTLISIYRSFLGVVVGLGVSAAIGGGIWGGNRLLRRWWV